MVSLKFQLFSNLFQLPFPNFPNPRNRNWWGIAIPKFPPLLIPRFLRHCIIAGEPVVVFQGENFDVELKVKDPLALTTNVLAYTTWTRTDTASPDAKGIFSPPPPPNAYRTTMQPYGKRWMSTSILPNQAPKTETASLTGLFLTLLTCLFVTSKNETTNSPIHEFKMLHNGQRVF